MIQKYNVAAELHIFTKKKLLVKTSWQIILNKLVHHKKRTRANKISLL